MNHIESNADTRGGKPRIAGTRITVADIVLMHRRLGRALEEIAGTYDLPIAVSTLRWLTITIIRMKLITVLMKKKR